MSVSEAAVERKPRISMIEVIVLLVIVVGSATILLPSLPASREAARIQTCQNNLRRFDLAIAMVQSQQPALEIRSTSWPQLVLPHTSQLFGSQSTASTGFLLAEPRPQVLTCPSRMSEEDDARIQYPHYQLVLDSSKYKRWTGAKWRFRDRPVQLQANEQSWWVGIMISPEQAEMERREQRGPHGEGQYNETNGAGESVLLPIEPAASDSASAAS